MSNSGIYIKPSKRGSLRKHLGVPEGQNIPKSKLRIKESDSPAIRKKKQFAINASQWNKEDGGELLFLPEYGFGSWIKENSGIISGVGKLASMIPVVGQVAGPIISGIGTVAGALHANDQAQEEADAQQAMLDEQAAQQKKIQDTANRKIRFENIVDKNQIDYGPSFMELGGQIGMGMMGDPQIVDYTNGSTHQEGVGGIPVDLRGNPATTSKSSAVGMTERGEVTWNGYVFSNKLKLD